MVQLDFSSSQSSSRGLQSTSLTVNAKKETASVKLTNTDFVVFICVAYEFISYCEKCSRYISVHNTGII